MKHPHWTTSYREGMRIDARIQPRRDPAHVGADSSRYLDPGRPARLLEIHVYRDGIELTTDLHPAELAEIERYICRAAGIPFGPASIYPLRGPASSQLTLAIGGCHGGR